MYVIDFSKIIIITHLYILRKCAVRLHVFSIGVLKNPKLSYILTQGFIF
jgi:hypothetical protein